MATNSDINITLGKKVKDIRLQNNITREVLAESIDVSSRFLADVESGKVGISLSTLKNICKYLGVSSDYLLNLTESDERYSEKTELINRINQLDEKYVPELNKIVIAFSEATKK